MIPQSTNLQEPLCVVDMVLVEVLERRHRLGRQVLPSGLHFDANGGQCSDVVLFGDEEQLGAAAAPGRLNVYGLRHVVFGRGHYPAEDAHGTGHGLGDRVVVSRCVNSQRIDKRSTTTYRIIVV